MTVVVTGAFGFIGSTLVRRLLDEGESVVMVDSPENTSRLAGGFNLPLRKVLNIRFVDRSSFMAWLETNHWDVRHVFHLGAKTSTLETDTDLLHQWNVDYSKHVWWSCSRLGIPLSYASSAAVYGLGEHGFKDDVDVHLLRPLNPYGMSKLIHDRYVLETEEFTAPPRWAGFRFFNVYGAREDHKGNMASPFYRWIKATLQDPEHRMVVYRHPERPIDTWRDFVYVQDVVDVLVHHMRSSMPNGIYNVGTGCPSSFTELAWAVRDAFGGGRLVKYEPMPEAIVRHYQYQTQADLTNLRKAGYGMTFRGIKEGASNLLAEMRRQ